jgi:glycosyltransferase involved in cell wall biosynthesis
VDYFIANSQHVARRVRKYYRRDATVIYPPVDTELFKVADVRRDYFLVVGALVPYKRVDLAIEACNRLGVRLIIAGDGSEKKRLERLAGSTVEFIGPQTLDQLVTLYQGALALIHPGEEDFGIVPVEAQACGRPVIAYARGGVMETVVGGGEHPSGAFFGEQTIESLVQALKMFASGSFNPADARTNALRFSRSRFVGELRAYLRRCWNEVRSEDYAL